MFKLICVTQRTRCADDFIQRLGLLSAAGVDYIILREKDLPPADYLALARQAAAVCSDRLILHSFPDACQALDLPRLHVPLPFLKANPTIRRTVQLLGVSIHAPDEAREAEALGADYVTAGHIFDTACKQGLPGRGLDFLRETCAAVSLPVYAIGGIQAENIAAVQQAGAAGACVMSGLMTCSDPAAAVAALRNTIL